MASGIHDGHRERLRQRFLKYGLDNFQSHEILELMLFYSIPRRNTSEIAHNLINEFGDFAAVLDAPPEALMKVDGISSSSATLFSLCSQIVRRYQIEKEKPPQILDTTEKLGKIILPKLSYLPTETMMLISLDSRLKLLDASIVGEGSVSKMDITLRTILKKVLLVNAAYAVIAHNHPSELAIPSRTDIASTSQISESLKNVDVILFDHIIVGGNDYVSMRESQLFSDMFPTYTPPASNVQIAEK